MYVLRMLVLPSKRQLHIAKSEVIFDDRFSLKVLLISRDGQIPLDSRYFSSISFVYNEICTNEKAFRIQITLLPHFKTDFDLISRQSKVYLSDYMMHYLHFLLACQGKTNNKMTRINSKSIAK